MIEQGLIIFMIFLGITQLLFLAEVLVRWWRKRKQNTCSNCGFIGEPERIPMAIRVPPENWQDTWPDTREWETKNIVAAICTECRSFTDDN